MRRSVRLGRALVALAAVASAAVTVAEPVGAAAPDAAGWWWDGRVVGAPVAAPNPFVPERGLYVAGEPTGPGGVSALRFSLADGEHPSTLTLAIASAQGAPAVRACPAPEGWAPEQGGPMASAPRGDCTAASVRGEVSTDGTTVTFHVAALAAEGALNVVLLPVEGAVFQASFRAPGNEALAVTAAPSGDGAAAPATDETFGAITDGFASPSSASPLDVPLGPGAAVALPPAESSAPPAARPFAPTRTRPRAVALAPPAGVTEDERRDRLIAGLVFADLVLVALWALRQPARAPRRLRPALATGAPLASPAVAAARGVGRFRRTRTGRPIGV